VALMGVLNVTPDSFSDGGRFLAPAQARLRVDELLAQGADIVDIGGESTRPGAAPVPADEQIARIVHALEYAAKQRGALVSVDTSSPEVASFALDRGAAVVNDVSCLADGDLARKAADKGGSLVIMHARGRMSDMRGFSEAPDEAYQDVVADVRRELGAARDRAVAAGLDASDVVLDPGIGFMKNAMQSLEIIRRLGDLASLGAPIMVGPSRKSFIAKIAGDAAPADRLGGTIAACLACADAGAAVLRVHDVLLVGQALTVHRALRGANA
jgi:dihydropteroate synthase